MTWPPMWRHPFRAWQSMATRSLTGMTTIALLRRTSEAQTSPRTDRASGTGHALPVNRAFQWALGGTRWIVACCLMVAVLLSAQIYYVWWPTLHPRGQAGQDEPAVPPSTKVGDVSHPTLGNEPLKSVTLAETHRQLTEASSTSATSSASDLSIPRPAHRAPQSLRSKNQHAAISRHARRRKHKTHHLSAAH